MVVAIQSKTKTIFYLATKFEVYEMVIRYLYINGMALKFYSLLSRKP